MNKRLTTAAIALALGLAWTVAPAMAQQSTTEKMKDKAETAKDKIEEKATDIKDKIHDTAVDLKDKAKAKMHRTSKADTDIVAMQRALMDKGYDPGPLDGRMGKRTRAALRDYQKKEGLNPTGRWDEETGNRLGVRMSRATPSDTMHSSTPSASPSAVLEDKTTSSTKRNAP